MATWTIDEEFAREHARALRELASVLQALKDEPDAGFDPVRPDELTRIAAEFERAVKPEDINAELLAALEMVQPFLIMDDRWWKIRPQVAAAIIKARRENTDG